MNKSVDYSIDSDFDFQLSSSDGLGMFCERQVQK